MCSAHVVHNCAENNCTIVSIQTQKQERSDVDQLVPGVSHVNPNDCVLNCVKMRDFWFTQEFCVDMPVPDRDGCIQRGAVQEINARRRKAAAQEADATAQLNNSQITHESSERVTYRSATPNTLQATHHNASNSMFNFGPQSDFTGGMNRRMMQQDRHIASQINPLDRVRAQG